MSAGPSSGDASDTGTSSTEDGTLSELEPNLILYKLLRNEILSRISHQSQSLLTGLSVIGLIIAYSLLSEQFLFLAIIPVIIGVLAVEATRQFNSILFISSYLCKIEGKYTDEYPLFKWERQYGMIGTERHIKQYGVNWSLVPSVIIVLFSVLGYIMFIYIGYIFWPTSGVDISIGRLTRASLAGIYGLLTVLVLFAGYSYYLHWNEFRSGEK